MAEKMSTNEEKRELPAENNCDGSVLFVLDRDGTRAADDVENQTTISNLPLYTSNVGFQKLATCAKERNIEDITTTESPRTCFMATPRKVVYGPKRKFLQKQLSGGWTTSKTNSVRNRYHVEDGLRFSAMRPGVISESLRTALGLDPNQLPLYIYRMRLFGYPPGHLENACRQRSGILLFTKDGCEVTTHGEVLEEGEVNDEQEEVMYNFDQLIDFPGFNVDPPTGTVDECEELELPSMQVEHNKEAMKQRLLSPLLKGRNSDGKEEPLKKPVYRVPETPLQNCSDNRVCHRVTRRQFSQDQVNAWLYEMGLSAADGWCILDALSEADEEERFTSTNFTKETDSSSLRGVPHDVPSNGAPPADNSRTQNLTEQIILSPLSGSNEKGEFYLDTSKTSDAMTKRIESYGSSFDVSCGTPVMLDDAYWSELPDASRFSAGMADPIPFENLPNATGAFQRLRNVLKASHSKMERPLLLR